MLRINAGNFFFRAFETFSLPHKKITFLFSCQHKTCINISALHQVNGKNRSEKQTFILERFVLLTSVY